MFPFFLLYCILMIADICVVIAVLCGALVVPKWMALLNSIVFLIIGVVFRKINPDKFQDNKNIFYCWMAGVIPQYRKSGVLTAMMEYLKNWSKEQGYKNLRIKTRNTRREMLSFLVKNNFNFYEIEAQENIRDNRICLEIHL